VTIPMPRLRACSARCLRTALASSAVVLAAVAVGACGGSTSASSSSSGLTVSPTGQVPVKPTQGGALTIARPSDPITLNPLLETDVASESAAIQIFDQLVETIPGKPGYQPGLAKSWTVSSDGLTYTFELRAAKFSNGQPVTPEDVVFSLDKAKDPATGSAIATLYAPMKTIEATGPSEVKIDLSQPTPGLLGYLSMPQASILPAKIYRQLGPSKFALNPIGSGAFKVQSFVKGQRLVMVRNPDYWRAGLPYLDKVTLVPMADDNARVLSLRSGSADIAEGVPYSQLRVVAKDASLQLLIAKVTVLETGGIFNERVKPLDEQLVRQALNYATPRDAINKTVFAGLAQPANSVLPRMDDWDPSVKPYPYDVAKAKALLAQSSVPHGFTVQLTIVGSDQASQTVAQILQNAWSKIGVKLTIRGVDVATEAASVPKGDFQMIAFPSGTGNSDSPTPDELVGSLIASDALNTGYHDAAVKALAARVIVASNPAEHTRLVHELQQAALDDPIDVPLLFSPARAGLKKTVHGFGYVTTGWFRLDQTSIG